ncbi:hypothetical protein EW026_g2210 [Hermanssonia centrifuga]|uniref:DDB1- and CUL4-associated factor 13 n=1 Tax=Hermanssonia centrifuga TaxID=98765 RepID=A0A4S4KQ00_9APHY|nr:hypothetical protein EW026_g2210 [Hermanssonia centrifuga]
MHPFARARERTRALNAAKIERIFAKPFVAAFEGHGEAVETMSRRPESLNAIASGGWDGGLIVHDISRGTHMLRVEAAHKGKISGVCFADENHLLSCGVDRNVKLWDTRQVDENGAGPSESQKPLSIFPGKAAFNSIDHHRSDPLFATASTIVQVWDETKSAPISNLTFPTSTETISAVRFNLSESSVLASIGSDRTFTLYDIRTGKAERRVVMQAHVAAVTSCDWSPTGLEFVSGGWDRTVRVWKQGVGTQPEVYHTKRMQRVTSTLFTADARFVLSGSDDGNVRMWKARASEKLGIIDARERAAIEYRDTLKERWKFDPEVGKVSRTRHVPKPVYKASQIKRTMLDAQRVKEERRRKHTRAGESKPKAERKKVVITEQT